MKTTRSLLLAFAAASSVAIVGCNMVVLPSPKNGSTPSPELSGAVADAAVKAIYDHPKYGDIVTVKIEGGRLKIGEFYAYQPVLFELARGECKTILFRRKDQPQYFRAMLMDLSPDGSEFRLDCSSGTDSFRTKIPADDNWKAGSPQIVEKEKNYLGRTVKQSEGMYISISYKPIP